MGEPGSATNLDQAQLVAKALEAAFQFSPLARIPEWIAAGKAPTTAELRAQGLTTQSTTPERIGQLRLARRTFIRTYGFSIPCSDALRVLSRMGPLVEIGAGSGYWSALMRNAGLDAVATDPVAEGDIGYGFQAGRFCPVEPLSGAGAVQAHPDRDVLCSWPTEGSPWALAAVRAMQPERRLALIGEPRGGVTGSPGLFRYLETRFRLLGMVEIPQFPRIRDALYVYQRIR